jgi:hypothetical protein
LRKVHFKNKQKGGNKLGLVVMAEWSRDRFFAKDTDAKFPPSQAC